MDIATHHLLYKLFNLNVLIKVVIFGALQLLILSTRLDSILIWLFHLYLNLFALILQFIVFSLYSQNFTFFLIELLFMLIGNCLTQFLQLLITRYFILFHLISNSTSHLLRQREDRGHLDEKLGAVGRSDL